MLNNNWEQIRLGEIANISSGSTPSRKVATYWNGDIPWVTTGEIDYNDILNTREKITQQGIEAASLKLYPPETILMAMIGQGATRGRVAKLKISATINQNCCAIVPSRRILSDFLFYYLESQYQRIRDLSNAGGQQNLNGELIRSIWIPLAPIVAQKHIVEIFSIWDRSIGLTTQLIAAKQQRKQGLMQQLLTGKRRFPEFSKRWQTVTIGDFLSESRISGSDGRTARKVTVKLYGKGVLPKEEKNSGSAATKYYQRRAGQFIYSKLDFLNGAFGIIPPEMDGYESTLDLPCFDFQGTIIPQFFLYFVSRESFYSRFASSAVGGRKARRIQVDEFLATEIEIPAREEQEKIVAILSSCDRELTLLNRKLVLLKKQKQGLMQQLLTGRIRVKT